MNLITLFGGILLAALIAITGTFAGTWIGEDLLGFDKSPISAIMLSILIGILIGNTTNAAHIFNAGIQFCLKRILMLGIILLGIRLGLSDMAQLGLKVIFVILPCIISALWLVNKLLPKFDVTKRMAVLIAVGTSICGASAIVATGPAIGADEDETAYAIANITLFGLIAMLLYPIIGHYILEGNPLSIGLFLGSSIHETAQVAGAGMIYNELFQSSEVLDTATVTKLIRNTTMIFVIPFLAFQFHKRDSAARSEISIKSLFPLFILGFILLGGIRTIGDISLQNKGSAFGLFNGEDWAFIIGSIKSSAKFLLATAMAAVGISTNIGSLKKLGIKPFYLGFVSAVAVGCISLVIIKVFLV